MNSFTTGGRKATNLVVIAVAVVVIFIGIVGSFIHYYGLFYDRVLKRETGQMKIAAKYIRTIVEQEFDRCTAIIDTSEESLRYHDINDKQDMMQFLKSIKKSDSKFKNTGFINMQGEAIFDNGTELVIKNDSLLQSIGRDDNFFSHFYDSKEPEDGTLLIAVPAHKNGDIVGAIFVYYPVSALSENIGFIGRSLRYFQLVDSKGDFIGGSNDQYSFANRRFSGRVSLWEELAHYEIANGITVEKIRNTMQAHGSGNFYFEYDGQGRYVVYEPLGINNWYIFSVLVESNLKAYTDNLKEYFLEYLFWLVLAMLLLFIIFILSDLEKRRIINAQNQKLLVNNKLFSLILGKTRDIPFEIHLNEKRLIRHMDHINGGENVYEVIEDFSPEAMLAQDQIHAEDYERYKRIYQDVLVGKVCEPEIFHLKLGDTWSWVKIYMLNVENDILVGFLEDYNEQNLQQEQVVLAKQKASQDTLTGLLNRESFIYKVNEIMARPKADNSVNALFLIDLDYFKEVNDTLGHIIGDQVLLDVATNLRSVVRSSDVVGRLGGDEFVVFIVDAADVHGVHRCAQKLNATLKKVYTRSGKEVAISASIGVAIAEPGLTFEDLYSMADGAVYDVKRLNKDGYQIAQEKEN